MQGAGRHRFEAERERPLRIAQHVAVTPIATGSGTTLFTADADTDFLVESLWVANITGTAATLGLYIGAVEDAKAAIKGLSVAANGRVPLCEAQGLRYRLQPGAALIAVAGSASALNMGGWGYSVSGGEQ